MKSLYLVILNARVLNQLETLTLHFLTFLFNFKQIVWTLLIAFLDFIFLLVQLGDEVFQLSDFLFPVLFSMQLSLKLGNLRINWQVFFCQSFDDVIFGFNFIVQDFVFFKGQLAFLTNLVELLAGISFLFVYLKHCLVNLQREFSSWLLNLYKFFLELSEITLTSFNCFNFASLSFKKGFSSQQFAMERLNLGFEHLVIDIWIRKCFLELSILLD